jgi:hypothetical protein
LRGQLGALSPADVELDAGLLLELLKERFDDFFLATRVDREGTVVGAVS